MPRGTEAFERRVRTALAIPIAALAAGCVTPGGTPAVATPTALRFSLSRAEASAVTAAGSAAAAPTAAGGHGGAGDLAEPGPPGDAPPAVVAVASGGGSHGASGGATADAPAAEPPLPPGDPYAGGAGAGPLTMTGTVRLAVPDGDGPPIAGATISALTLAGDTPLTAVSDADGGFSLDLPDGTATVLVTAPGRTPSLLPSWKGAPLTVHLQDAFLPPLPLTAEVPVAGVVRRADGGPAVRAVVVGGDGRGSAFGPLVTDADGRFAGRAQVVAGEVRMAVWALAREANGAVTGLGLAADAPVAEDAPDVAIALVPPTGRVTVRPVAAAGQAGQAAASFGLRAANGVAVTLHAWRGGDLAVAPAPAQFFALPGATAEADAELVADGGLRKSAWHAAVDAPADLAPALLAYPAPEGGAAALAATDVFRWPGVHGATGYRVALQDPGMPTPLWEAFAAEAAVVARGLPAPAALAGADLYVTAYDGPGLRSLASLPGFPGGFPAALLRIDPAPPAPTRWATTIAPHAP